MRTKEPESTIVEEVKGSSSFVQVIKVQAEILQSVPGAASLSLLEERDTVMGDPSRVVIVDPSVGLPAFLSYFVY